MINYIKRLFNAQIDIFFTVLGYFGALMMIVSGSALLHRNTDSFVNVDTNADQYHSFNLNHATWAQNVTVNPPLCKASESERYRVSVIRRIGVGIGGFGERIDQSFFVDVCSHNLEKAVAVLSTMDLEMYKRFEGMIYRDCPGAGIHDIVKVGEPGSIHEYPWEAYAIAYTEDSETCKNMIQLEKDRKKERDQKAAVQVESQVLEQGVTEAESQFAEQGAIQAENQFAGQGAIQDDILAAKEGATQAESRTKKFWPHPGWVEAIARELAANEGVDQDATPRTPVPISGQKK